MKGKIDKNGYLFIKRGGKYEPQLCPHSTHLVNDCVGFVNCGEWCVKFGEPKEIEVDLLNDTEKLDGIYLNVCELCLEFEEFTDEREAI